MDAVETIQTPDDDYLATLNTAQRKAATFGESRSDGGVDAGPLLVIAGAGTGKTMTLAHRVAHLVLSGVDPSRILLLTFTRRAASEMTRRVESIVRAALRADGANGQRFALPWAGTFHSIANRLLRQFAHNVGLDPSFSVLDRGDAADLMDVVRHELGLSKRSRRFPKKDTCLAIYSRTVNTRADLKIVIDETFPWCADWEQELRALYRGYVERKLKVQALDYDDLLLYLGYLVAEEEFATTIGGWFDHVLVDEYQDTNRVQADILLALKPDGRGLSVVGDDAQSIYSFRAASVDNILSFPDQFMPSAEIVTLEENYRSTQAVLDSANCLIAESERQYRKHLFSRSREGSPPGYVTVEDGDAEAEFVVETILENREAGMQLKDQAVLFRGSHTSDRLEIELLRRNIPYVKFGGLKFLEAAHVKDVLSILKWADNPRNEVAAFRVLKLLPGIGPAMATKCYEHLALHDHRFESLLSFVPPAAAKAEWPGFTALIESLASQSGHDTGWQSGLAELRRWYRPVMEQLYDSVETREADIEQLEQISGRYPTRERFLTELTLDPPASAGAESGDPLLDEDYLILSTVHSAKGQEWEAVFVLNVTDGSFPSEFATGKAELIEEERRLLYVAMTRAKQSLTLVAPLRFHVTQQPRDGDRHVYGARSRFMTDRLLGTMRADFRGRHVARDGARSSRSSTQIDVGSRMREMW
ncbi:MAG: ATP-dependent helicase [Pseudomonadota bacterium]